MLHILGKIIKNQAGRLSAPVSAILVFPGEVADKLQN